MEKYEPIKSFLDVGEAKLVIDKKTKELFVVEYIQRGGKIDAKVERKMINHMSLRHPNIIKLKEASLTSTHLAIVKEYAGGGKLFDKIRNGGRFREDEARSYFQQLISGLSYCHSMDICQGELQLNHTLLDDGQPPRLKICGPSYSQSEMPPTRGKRAASTPMYVAPEILSQKENNDKIADVWCCGLMLYMMLVGAYPFEDPNDPCDLRRTIVRILGVQYSIPDSVRLSADCTDLISRIFVADPSKRITIPEIKKHPWFLINCPKDLFEGENTNYGEKYNDKFVQSEEELMRSIEEARTPGEAAQPNTMQDPKH